MPWTSCCGILLLPTKTAEVLKAMRCQWDIQDKQMIYITEKHLLNVEPDMLVNLSPGRNSCSSNTCDN
jgi:hypothetical protein